LNMKLYTNSTSIGNIAIDLCMIAANFSGKKLELA